MNQNCEFHVLHIVSGDLWAGAEAQMFTLAKTLHTQLDVTVTVVTLNQGRLEQELRKIGIPVIVVDETRFNGIMILLQLIKTVRKLKPDIIHTHRVKENVLGSIAAKLNGIPSLRTAHGAPEHNLCWYQIPKRTVQFLDWLCGRFIQHRIIAVSEDLAVILRLQFPAQKIHTIENGIEFDALTQFTKREPNSTLKIGIAGRLVPVKRVDLFVQAAKHLHDLEPDLDIDFQIYGDGPLRSELESLSRDLGTETYLHFEGHCDDIITILNNLDLLLMTSDHEGLPMILLEAMTLGTPIVAHRVGGITNLLDHGNCGILVEEQDPEAYAIEVRRLVKNSSLRDELARKALEQIRTRYNADRNASEYCTEYKGIL